MKVVAIIIVLAGWVMSAGTATAATCSIVLGQTSAYVDARNTLHARTTVILSGSTTRVGTTASVYRNGVLEFQDKGVNTLAPGAYRGANGLVSSWTLPLTWKGGKARVVSRVIACGQTVVRSAYVDIPASPAL